MEKITTQEEEKASCENVESDIIKTKSTINQDWLIYDCLLYPHMCAEDHFVIFNRSLQAWLERKQLGRGYNKDVLDFYDGVIGYIIKHTNYYIKNKEKIWVPPYVFDFMEIWKYQGVIYRVIDAPISKVRYHKKIASWTKRINAFDKFNHLYKDCKYTFLIANTKDMCGFDVNNYNDYFNQGNRYIKHEEEVIFPMDKKYIIDVFYGTLDEFKAHVEKLNQKNIF